MPSTAILWFRRDLRVHDHPALTAALAAADVVIPVFVIDDALLTGRWSAPNRAWFMRESLVALSGTLAERGAALRILRGRPAGRAPGVRPRDRCARPVPDPRCRSLRTPAGPGGRGPAGGGGHHGPREARPLRPRARRGAHARRSPLHRLRPVPPGLGGAPPPGRAAGAGPDPRAAGRPPRRDPGPRPADGRPGPDAAAGRAGGSRPPGRLGGRRRGRLRRSPQPDGPGRHLAALAGPALGPAVARGGRGPRRGCRRWPPHLRRRDRLARVLRPRPGPSSARPPRAVQGGASPAFPGATTRTPSRPGARAGPATRWWTRPCASCARPGSSTTVPA